MVMLLGFSSSHEVPSAKDSGWISGTWNVLELFAGLEVSISKKLNTYEIIEESLI